MDIFLDMLWQELSQVRAELQAYKLAAAAPSMPEDLVYEDHAAAHDSERYVDSNEREIERLAAEPATSHRLCVIDSETHASTMAQREVDEAERPAHAAHQLFELQVFALSGMLMCLALELVFV